MKTAISIPDEILGAAEELARKLQVSRSELFTRAVSAFIREYSDDEITARLNEIYGQEDSTLEPVLRELQFASLPHEEWE